MSIPARSIRLQCDIASPNHVLDRRTGNTPTAIKGAALLVQLGLFLKGTIVDDVSNYDALTLKLRALDATTGAIGDVVVSKALAADALDEISDSDWRDESDQNAEFTLTSAELNIAAGTYWLVIVGDTADGERVPWAAGKFAINDQGVTDDTAEPPEFLPTDGPTCKRGRFEFAQDDVEGEAAFVTAFASAPRCIMITPFKPADQPSVQMDRRSGHTAASFFVDAPVGIPAAGYGFDWVAYL